ncbi:hypothetical protein Pmar_PMAR000727 [Perkinsus marinus ATCC 50983]|uniref:Uncharacterized protein n=1 Tax=Perkinsus marinus (strain ATCC 50983 / TXsc) TaxID=423536 RepID=C5KXG8_PERM5|nr:hypothetical protein Pmar_PMAR000727 [Perkinsus marinus ATCC 50983]EER10692.1 hypothetical protein Pmar_PMAR000727 [Perkinsus marinus ATCC 50983]|eukprot:XP_002778897.1 hypothetical protein Pmar_PMAR000727 [Perkinsus marinus ATCC 50983]
MSFTLSFGTGSTNYNRHYIPSAPSRHPPPSLGPIDVDEQVDGGDLLSPRSRQEWRDHQLACQLARGEDRTSALKDRHQKRRKTKTPAPAPTAPAPALTPSQRPGSPNSFHLPVFDERRAYLSSPYGSMGASSPLPPPPSPTSATVTVSHFHLHKGDDGCPTDPEIEAFEQGLLDPDLVHATRRWLRIIKKYFRPKGLDARDPRSYPQLSSGVSSLIMEVYE